MRFTPPTSTVLLATVLVAMVACETPPSNAPQGSSTPASRDADIAAVRGLVEKHVRAANTGNLAMAEEAWLQTDDVSMITPAGHHAGWTAIRQDYYAQFFDTTSKRTLTTSDLSVHLFGDMAVAEFTWVFDATLSANGSQIHAKGWESQISNRMPDGQWKLVHIHYSAAPAE